MRDSLTSDNVRDFSARYVRTYGWFVSDAKKRILVRVERVTEREVQFVDATGTKYFAAADKGAVFEFLPVTRGLYNSADGGLVFLTRQPARQWHRGICSANTSAMYYTAGRMRATEVTLDLINGVFHCGKPNEHFVKMLVNGKNNTAALSKFFAIADEQVFFMDQTIGMYKKGVITLREQNVRQELCDTIKRNAYPLEVAV